MRNQLLVIMIGLGSIAAQAAALGEGSLPGEQKSETIINTTNQE